MACCGLITVFGRAIGEALAGAPAVDLRPPVLQRRGVGPGAGASTTAIRSASTLAGVADDADVGAHHLADRRGVDVDVDLLRAGREGVQPAGDPVVEARADRRPSRRSRAWRGWPRRRRACRPCPARPDRWPGTRPGPSGSRSPARRSGPRTRAAGRWRRAGVDHAAAGVEDRPLGAGRSAPPPRRCGPGRPWCAGRSCGCGRGLVGPDIDARGELDVLGDVDDHRAGPAAGGDLEGLVHHPRQVLDAFDQVVVLGAGAGDADGVGTPGRRPSRSGGWAPGR